MWDLLRLIQKGGIYMENRVYDMEKGQFAFLYKLPPKLILFLSTIVWLAADRTAAPWRRRMAGGRAAYRGRGKKPAGTSCKYRRYGGVYFPGNGILRKRDLFNKKKVSFQESTG